MITLYGVFLCELRALLKAPPPLLSSLPPPLRPPRPRLDLIKSLKGKSIDVYIKYREDKQEVMSPPAEQQNNRRFTTPTFTSFFYYLDW